MNVLLWITDFDGLKSLLIVCIMMYSQSHFLSNKDAKYPIAWGFAFGSGFLLKKLLFSSSDVPLDIQIIDQRSNHRGPAVDHC